MLLARPDVSAQKAGVLPRVVVGGRPAGDVLCMDSSITVLC